MAAATKRRALLVLRWVLIGAALVAVVIALLANWEAVSTQFSLPPLDFVASWLSAANALVPETLAGMASETAQSWREGARNVQAAE